MKTTEKTVCRHCGAARNKHRFGDNQCPPIRGWGQIVAFPSGEKYPKNEDLWAAIDAYWPVSGTTYMARCT